MSNSNSEIIVNDSDEVIGKGMADIKHKIKEIIAEETSGEREINIDNLASETGQNFDLIYQCLSVLASDDIIEYVSDDRFRVRKITKAEFEKSVELLKRLEKPVLEELIKNFDRNKHDLLLKIVKKTEDAERKKDKPKMVLSGIEFHEKMAELAGFGQAAKLLDTLQYRMSIDNLRPKFMHNMVESHRRLIQELDKGTNNLPKAERILATDINNFYSRLAPKIPY